MLGTYFYSDGRLIKDILYFVYFTVLVVEGGCDYEEHLIYSLLQEGLLIIISVVIGQYTDCYGYWLLSSYEECLTI